MTEEDIRADERERCARECEVVEAESDPEVNFINGPLDCAARIRALGPASPRPLPGTSGERGSEATCGEVVLGVGPCKRVAGHPGHHAAVLGPRERSADSLAAPLPSRPEVPETLREWARALLHGLDGQHRTEEVLDQYIALAGSPPAPPIDRGLLDAVAEEVRTSVLDAVDYLAKTAAHEVRHMDEDTPEYIRARASDAALDSIIDRIIAARGGK
jgi:hypothetical protein